MDYLIRGTDKENKIKFVFAITTQTVEKARQIHNTSMTASAVLGRTLTAGALLATNLKNQKDNLTIIINGDGPAGRIIAIAGGDGSLKAYMDHPEIDLPIREDGKIDVRAAVGKGNISVNMDLGLKEPYCTNVPIVDGEIGQDFANYLYTSDQVPSVVGLGVLVDRDLSIKAAGGFMIQLLPGYCDEDINSLEKSLKDIKSVTDMINKGMSPEDMAAHVLDGYDLKILRKDDLDFECDCSRQRVEKALISLGKKELQAMKDEDHQAEVNCHFCKEKYIFTEEDLEKLIKSLD